LQPRFGRTVQQFTRELWRKRLNFIDYRVARLCRRRPREPSQRAGGGQQNLPATSAHAI
jgi:hypothetical protein